MRVEQVMTKGVATCGPQDSAETAARLMWENDCGCVPVVNGSTVAGMITDRDICMAAYFRGQPLREIPISVAMSKAVAVCKSADTLEAAEHTMTANKVRRLPVVDAQNQIVGILSINDIARQAARERSRVGREVTDAEVGETISVVGQPHNSR